MALAAVVAGHLPSLAADTMPVTVDNFVRAESDLYSGAIAHQTVIRLNRAPTVEGPVVKFDFPITELPGVEAFDKTAEILASEPDINEGMAEMQNKALAVGEAAKDPAQRAHLDEVIRTMAIPAFMAAVPKTGATGNGWMRPRIIGNYGSDYQIRSIANFAGIWANNQKEVVYFMVEKLDGSKTYTQTYPKDALPASKVGYFWSVIAVDSAKFQVIPNPLNRFLLNKQSGLELNADGALTLAFAPKKPLGLPEPNWLPTPEGQPYNLTYRFYGPSQDIVSGAYRVDLPPSALCLFRTMVPDLDGPNLLVERLRAPSNTSADTISIRLAARF